MEIAALVVAALSAVAASVGLWFAKQSAGAAKKSADAAKRSADSQEATLKLAEEARKRREAERAHVVSLTIESVERASHPERLIYHFSAVVHLPSVPHVVVSIVDGDDNELGAMPNGVSMIQSERYELQVVVPVWLVTRGMRARVRWLDRETQQYPTRISEAEVDRETQKCMNRSPGEDAPGNATAVPTS